MVLGLQRLSKTKQMGMMGPIKLCLKGGPLLDIMFKRLFWKVGKKATVINSVIK